MATLRQRDPTKAKADRQAHYIKNKTRVLALAAEYRIAHREEERAARLAHYQRNKAKVAADTKAYREANRELYNEAFARRRAANLRAVPAWSDRAAVQAIYADATKLTKETGIPHEVDHEVPIQSRWVCGLHCEANLKIVPRAVNRGKANVRWPDMGAIVDLPHHRRKADFLPPL